jgi:hypothetical protein
VSGFLPLVLAKGAQSPWHNCDKRAWPEYLCLPRGLGSHGQSNDVIYKWELWVTLYQSTSKGTRYYSPEYEWSGHLSLYDWASHQNSGPEGSGLLLWLAISCVCFTHCYLGKLAPLAMWDLEALLLALSWTLFHKPLPFINFHRFPFAVRSHSCEHNHFSGALGVIVASLWNRESSTGNPPNVHVVSEGKMGLGTPKLCIVCQK